jgi:hypothetical protein
MWQAALHVWQALVAPQALNNMHHAVTMATNWTSRSADLSPPQGCMHLTVGIFAVMQCRLEVADLAKVAAGEPLG